MTVPQLDGRVALVTGAGHGIGLAIAAKLGAAGASVVVDDLTSAIAESRRRSRGSRGPRYALSR